MRGIIIGWGKMTRGRDSRYTGRRTAINAYGHSTPEIEADALRRAAPRFAPGAVLEADPNYAIYPIAQPGGIATEKAMQDEAATRPPAITKPRPYSALMTVRELKQPISRDRSEGVSGPS